MSDPRDRTDAAKATRPPTNTKTHGHAMAPDDDTPAEGRVDRRSEHNPSDEGSPGAAARGCPTARDPGDGPPANPDRATGETVKSNREKPPRCVIDPAGIPASLKAQVIWVVWKWVWKPNRAGDPDGPGRWTKPPFHPVTNRKTDATNADNLSTFAVALAAYEAGKCDGIGIALAAAGLCGYDLDDVRDPATGDLHPLAVEEVKALDTYAEVSPTGTGLKALCVARKPGPACKATTPGGYTVELYDSVRYFTVTGRATGIDGLPAEPQPRQGQVEALYAKLWPKAGGAKAGPPGPPPACDKSDRELLAKAFAARNNGPRIRNLFNGIGGPDASANDLALLSLLAFYFPDRDRLEAVFSASALGQRAKWKERPDYRARTIAKAYENLTGTYSPKGPTVTATANGQPLPSGPPRKPLPPPPNDPAAAAHTWRGGRDQTTVLEFAKPAKSPDHPTTKPVDLFARLIENSGPPGGRVLDPFGGSGTTLLAAESTGRTACLVELDPRYCDVIARRFRDVTGQAGQRVPPGA